MGRVVILGSGYAIGEDGHENTHLLIEQGEHCLLVDSSTSPIGRLKKAGVAYNRVTDLVLTHFHPDHVGGVPAFLMDSWLLGRKQPLQIYGLPYTIDRMENMMGLFDWKKWPNFYPVIFHRLPDQEMSLVIGSQTLRLYTSPVKHLLPTIGLRAEFLPEEKTMAYSCDTEPCPQVVNLAHQVDVLIHEATGGSVGHSSAAQAGHIARQAEARSLYLIHYNAEHHAEKLAEARQVYSGNVNLATDGLVLDF